MGWLEIWATGNVDEKSVRCPRCAAQPGEPCSTTTGQPHQRRIERACSPPQETTRTCAREGCDNQFTLTGIGSGSMQRRYCGEPDCERHRQRDRERRRYAAGTRRIPCDICENPTGRLAHQPGPNPPICQPCRRKRAMRVCEQCGDEFSAIGRPDARYCRAQCHHESMRKSQAEKAACRIVRAEQIKSTRDGVTNQQIYERDNWTCQIPDCTQPTRKIDREAPWPAPTSRSIDHIIPITRGGSDHSTNRRAAHLRCNIVKHDRLDDEIMPQLQPKPKTTCANCGKRTYKDTGLCSTCRRPPRRLCPICGINPARKGGRGGVVLRCEPCNLKLREQIIDLREGGWMWKDIARAVGLSGPGAAQNVAYPPW